MEEAAKADHIGIISKGHFVEYGTPFSLKERYAGDKLYLVPKSERWQEVRERLEKLGLGYTMSEERIFVRIGDTMSSLPLINKMEGMLQGFEVIQGTMDDVFLNVTKEDGNEEIC